MEANMLTSTIPMMGRPKKDEEREKIRVPKSLALKLRRLAADADMDISDYFARELGPEIDRLQRKMIDRLAREGRKDGKDGSA